MKGVKAVNPSQHTRIADYFKSLPYRLPIDVCSAVENPLECVIEKQNQTVSCWANGTTGQLTQKPINHQMTDVSVIRNTVLIAFTHPILHLVSPLLPLFIEESSSRQRATHAYQSIFPVHLGRNPHMSPT